jgi:L-fuconolactonase
VKISGACTMSLQLFPYDDIWDPVLRVIDAFGLDRCMWGTDWTRTIGMLTYEQVWRRSATPNACPRTTRQC